MIADLVGMQMWATTNGDDKPIFSGGATTALGAPVMTFFGDSSHGGPPRLVDLRSISG